MLGRNCPPDTEVRTRDAQAFWGSVQMRKSHSGLNHKGRLTREAKGDSADKFHMALLPLREGKICGEMKVIPKAQHVPQLPFVTAADR